MPYKDPKNRATLPCIVKNPRRPLGHAASTVGMMNEFRVSVDLTSRGYEVFKALDAGASCDLIALKNGQSFRVQVKTAQAYNLADGGIRLMCDRTRPERYDILAVVERTSLDISYEPVIDAPTPDHEG